MAEVLFYQLTERPLDQALPELLEKSLERGWRVLVRGTEAARLERLDTMLWTRRQEDFLPHGRAGGAHDAAQPVLLTTTSENTNRAEILMLVDGARVELDEVSGFTRACVMFDGHDDQQLSAAREDWKAVSDAGMTAQYWAQDDGRWVKKAESGG